MVYGYQEARKGGVFEKASGGFFTKPLIYSATSKSQKILPLNVS